MRVIVALLLAAISVPAFADTYREPKDVLTSFSADRWRSTSGLKFESLVNMLDSVATSGRSGNGSGAQIVFRPRGPNFAHSVTLEVARPATQIVLTCYVSGGGSNGFKAYMTSGGNPIPLPISMVTSPKGPAFQIPIARNTFATLSEIFLGTVDAGDEWILKECVFSKSLKKAAPPM